jgi:hypothetical protein
MNLKSMREMNHLIMESQGLQSDEFISDKEKALTESQTDGVYVPTLPSDEYVSSKCKCGCEDGVCTCEEKIDGAAGTSDENVDAVMGSADTLSENLGISNSLSAKPTLKESADKGMVVDDESVEVAKKGANIEDEIIEKFNDMFIKEYKPQSKVTYDLDGTETKVETPEFKIPRGW